MSLQQFNLDLFYRINAPIDAHPWMIELVCFIAHDLVYIFCAIFALAWLFGNQDCKTGIVKATLFTAITLGLSEILSAVLNTPRPFVMDVGRTLIEHAATGSFPSNHMSIFSGIAFAYYFSPQRALGQVLIWIAILVAWSRVYVGVHFPIDMLGAFFLALFISLAGLPLWWKYETRIMNGILWIYHKVFHLLIARGWLKP